MVSLRRTSIGALALLMTNIHAETLKDVEYGRAGNISLRLDASIPAGPGPFGAVILVHGGAWVAGNRTSNVQPLFQPLSDAGFAWFSISYRLAADIARNPIAGAMQMGAAEKDVQTAVAFVKQHAAEYRIDPKRLVLMGESAGGQLAAMAALRQNAGVNGVVAFYTPSDLAALARNSTMIPDSVRDKVKGTLLDDLLMAGLKEVSPVNYISSSAPPFLLIHGTADDVVPISQSETFCNKLRESGVGCDLYPVIGGAHGIRNWESYRLTTYKMTMVRWLQQRLSRP